MDVKDRPYFGSFLTTIADADERRMTTRRYRRRRRSNGRSRTYPVTGSFDHEIMIGILVEKIHDERFLRLMRSMLKAGYLEDWTWYATLSGVPQGGTASPVLSN